MERDRKSLILALMNFNGVIQINFQGRENNYMYIFTYSKKHDRKSPLIDELRRNNDRD